jgi:hypothetical protein
MAALVAGVNGAAVCKLTAGAGADEAALLFAVGSVALFCVTPDAAARTSLTVFVSFAFTADGAAVAPAGCSKLSGANESGDVVIKPLYHNQD